ncbi:TlpA family protein disulfide reductase [Halobacillus litoralis]|uniref:TlpA family protein disulfide reductase n=1 Tax=Halobacillus litoralis TaxID=45668 RepID=UPI001CFEB813|nr:TlpA disulfide reductase family protein [Halobacillus litoralis]
MKKWLAFLFLGALLVFSLTSAWSDKKEEKVEGQQTPEAQAEQDGAGMKAPNAPEGLKVGQEAPDFTLETLQGETVKLSDFKGKKVFLNYWASWCPPCRDEMPEMQRFHEEFEDEVVILAVNGTGSEDNLNDVKDFVIEGGFSFTVLLDQELEINQLYQIISIPTTYFIGTDGVIQEQRIVGPMTYDYMVKMKNALN